MSAEAGLDESDQPRVESKIDDRMPNGLTDSRQAEDIPLPHDANARPIQRDPSQLSGSGRSGNVTPLTEIEYNDRNRPYNDRGRPYENRSPRPRVPKVVHKIEYRHVSSSAVVFEEESDRFAATKSPPEEPVLEVVTIAYTAIERAAYAFRDSVKPPPIHSMGYKYIQINSAAVINALRAVVEYYPGQNLIGDSITIHEPYLLLVHHLKELEEYRQIFAPENRVQNDEAEACVGEADTYEHLGIILDFLKDTQKDSLEKQKERHERERPVVTYELLWTLFKPGTDVFYDTDSCGTLDSYVVKSVHWKLSNGYPSRYEITLWNLDYDAVFIGPRNAVATVLPFEGEKEISSLDIFPCKYLREDIRGESLDAMTKRLEERGKMFFRLTQKQCLSYSGETTTFPRHKINGLVMVDAESFWGKVQAEKPPNVKIPPLLSEDVGERTIGGIPNCSCKRCKDLNDRNKRKSRFADYARINPLTVTELTPHQYFLCDRNVDGFHLKTRRWERLDAGCFSEPKFDTNMINELVIDDDIRTLLKNLSIKYTREVEEEDEKAGLWKSDFEQGKGEGMIVLLHGKPGVGKTYTAECVAEFTRRPLLSLTCTDIGTNPHQIESKLAYWFKLAKLWGAILLIDEADIYMESRVTRDLNRNHLVAGFLRAMEYYHGILFLTTNRVGTFDDAFISRIHVSVHYPDFSDQHRRDVWASFFRRLERERGGTMVIPEQTRRYALQSKEVKAVGWNGREIRNAVQTAVSLAEVENETDEEGKVVLKESHIAAIVRMSGGFKRYLRELHAGDESKRALREGIRYDHFERDEREGREADGFYV